MSELGIALMKILRELLKALYGIVILWFSNVDKD